MGQGPDDQTETMKATVAFAHIKCPNQACTNAFVIYNNRAEKINGPVCCTEFPTERLVTVKSRQFQVFLSCKYENIQ